MSKIDLLLVNSPLKNYDVEKKYNNQTLPVLGLGYIATVAANQGFNVDVLDAEALGLGIGKITQIIVDEFFWPVLIIYKSMLNIQEYADLILHKVVKIKISMHEMSFLHHLTTLFPRFPLKK